jgi:hypothetical protein
MRYTRRQCRLNCEHEVKERGDRDGGAAAAAAAGYGYGGGVCAHCNADADAFQWYASQNFMKARHHHHYHHYAIMDIMILLYF